MESPAHVRRVIIVVLDGLRPDAIDAFGLSNLRGLIHTGAATLDAQTVAPSLTWPAITSLMTGLHPETHGILADSVHLPRPRARLTPLPDVLARHGYPSSAFMGAIPSLYRGIASRIAKGLGFAEARFAGGNAGEIVGVARSTLRIQRRGLIFLHLPDADRAGHDHGWMSDKYADAARGVDTALGSVLTETRAHADPHTVLVALADHGGGGVRNDHHEDPHPVNATIPLAMAGGAIARVTLDGVGLIDIPPTALWLLGIMPPEEYVGRPLVEAVEPRAFTLPRQPAA
jgi:predicted AlkP superfamily pyrophosphatase or phosphodiesterase